MTDDSPSASSAPKVTRRIFLSYGHDERSALAVKLKCDVEQRGHGRNQGCYHKKFQAVVESLSDGSPH